MKKPNKYVDVVYLVLFGILLGMVFQQHYMFGQTVSINNLLAFIFLTIAVLLKIVSKKNTAYIVAVLLILSTLNIVNFSVITAGVKIDYKLDDGGSVLYGYPGINPLYLIMLIVYWVINKAALRDMWEMAFYGTKNEQVDNFRKKENFYHDKFSAYSDTDLEKVFEIYNDYPPEAKAALRRIHLERNLSILTFE